MLAKDTNLTFHQEATSYLDSYNLKEREVETISRRNTSYHNHYHPEESSGICVVRRKDESVEDLLKRFRKKYSKSGLAKEIRDKMYFEKPSERRRRKRMQSIRNIQREEEKLEEMKERQQKFRQKKARLQSKNKRKEYEQDDKSSSRQNRSRSYESKQDSRGTHSS
jgi:small subunit ribosomal protein S21